MGSNTSAGRHKIRVPKLNVEEIEGMEIRDWDYYETIREKLFACEFAVDGCDECRFSGECAGGRLTNVINAGNAIRDLCDYIKQERDA